MPCGNLYTRNLQGELTSSKDGPELGTSTAAREGKYIYIRGEAFHTSLIHGMISTHT